MCSALFFGANLSLEGNQHVAHAPRKTTNAEERQEQKPAAWSGSHPSCRLSPKISLMLVVAVFYVSRSRTTNTRRQPV